MIATPPAASISRIGSMIADSAKPGQTALTRIPSASSAGASERTSPTTACLLAA